jgi:hypothetical protein
MSRLALITGRYLCMCGLRLSVETEQSRVVTYDKIFGHCAGSAAREQLRTTVPLSATVSHTRIGNAPQLPSSASCLPFTHSVQLYAEFAASSMQSSSARPSGHFQVPAGPATADSSTASVWPSSYTQWV